MDKVTDTPEGELVDALIEALEKSQEKHEANTITTREFADALDMGLNAARRRLRKLQGDGVIEPAKVQRTNDWGTRQTVPGWRYVAD